MTCNKIPYESKELARNDAKVIMVYIRRRSKTHMVGKLRPYWCPACYKWHLTSGKKRKWSKFNHRR